MNHGCGLQGLPGESGAWVGMQVKQKRPSEASITAAHLDWSSALVQVGKICALLPFIFSMQYWPLEDFMVYAAIVNKRPVSGSALSCLAAASKMLFTGSTVQPILPAIFQGAFFLAAELLVEVGIFEGKLKHPVVRQFPLLSCHYHWVEHAMHNDSSACCCRCPSMQS